MGLLSFKTVVKLKTELAFDLDLYRYYELLSDIDADALEGGKWNFQKAFWVSLNSGIIAHRVMVYEVVIVVDYLVVHLQVHIVVPYKLCPRL